MTRTSKKRLKKLVVISLVFCFLFVSTASSDAFYRNLKEELIWALENGISSSTQGYSVSKYDDSFLGVIVGYDMVTNRIFIVGEVSSGKYEMCTWDLWGYGFNNLYDMFDIIITDGIVDEISAETPITYLYRNLVGDWNSEFLEDAESAFDLCYGFHGWDR